jgi:hypothetical protein
MNDHIDYVQNKQKGKKGESTIYDLLENSGYTVMPFGIEQHNQDVIKKLRQNYECDTNRMLRCMPDLVVIDPETDEAKLVEVKVRNVDWAKKPLFFNPSLTVS